MMTRFLVLLLVCCGLCSALNNGLALLPPMGFSSWNSFRCAYTEKDVIEIADALVSSGMAAAGYKYLNIDDCWEAETRDPKTGNLQFNVTKFPSGMKALSDYVHSKGLLLGLYTSSGEWTCQKFPGSWGHEEQDAKLFAEWGVDFLKLDACYQFTEKERKIAFERMSKALAAQKHSILFSCDSDELLLKEDDEEHPHVWAPAYCNMARIWNDINDNWQNTLEILDHTSNINYASRKGYWNDMDILTVGMGNQTAEEYKTQMSIWSVASSPLIAGNDIRKMDKHTLQVLTNPEVIAVNQDSLAKGGNMIRRSLDGTSEVWAKPLYHPKLDASGALMKEMIRRPYDKKRRSDLANNQRHTQLSRKEPPYDPGFIPLPLHAAVLFNRLPVPANVTLYFEDLFDHKLCPHPYTPTWTAEIRDLWEHKDLGLFENKFVAQNIPAHGSMMVRVLLNSTRI